MPAADPFARPWALVEVAPDATGEVRDALIRAAYLLSRRGLVALALSAVSRARMDAVLDQVVAATPSGIHGVVYIETDDHARVLDAATHASLIVASTEDFRCRLERAGISAVSDTEAAALLGAAAVHSAGAPHAPPAAGASGSRPGARSGDTPPAGDRRWRTAV